ncbi:hypothetical protein HDV06_007049 [Boothiomyces sp. JEL0866]|nr:hypothetical protein HDV06_007049 [Boothiomyces sp. JEL0866]
MFALQQGAINGIYKTHEPSTGRMTHMYISHFKLMYNLGKFDILELLEDDLQTKKVQDLVKENANLEELEKDRQELKDHLYSIPPWVDMESVQRANPKAVWRRLLETTKFVLMCMVSKDSLSPNSEGWNSIVKVRCLHASVRARLEARKTASSTDAFVNQTDMGHTLASFSFSILGLSLLGITFTLQDLLDYIHLWRYIGYYTGVRDEINPLAKSPEDLLEYSLQAYAHYFNRENASSRLSKVLNDSTPMGRKFSVAAAWNLNPNIICESFELEKPSWWFTVVFHFTIMFVRLTFWPIQLMIFMWPNSAFAYGRYCLNTLTRSVLKGDTKFNPVTIAKAGDDLTCPITGTSLAQVQPLDLKQSCPRTVNSGECKRLEEVINMDDIPEPQKAVLK